MFLHRSIALFLLALAAAPALWAQDKAAERAPASEPAVQRLVGEDDNVRIEEVRVRGQAQSITVHHKARGFRSYEIVPASGGRDPSQPGGSTGQRVWSFRF